MDSAFARRRRNPVREALIALAVGAGFLLVMAPGLIDLFDGYTPDDSQACLDLRSARAMDDDLATEQAVSRIATSPEFPTDIRTAAYGWLASDGPDNRKLQMSLLRVACE